MKKIHNRLILSGFIAGGIAILVSLIGGFIFGWHTIVPLKWNIIIITLYTYQAITFISYMILAFTIMYKKLKT